LSNQYKPFLLPFLLMLSLIPEGDKKLSQVNSIIEATHNVVQSLRSGIDGLHATLLEASENLYPSAPGGQKTSDDYVITKPAKTE
jgi:hypothetical protein